VIVLPLSNIRIYWVVSHNAIELLLNLRGTFTPAFPYWYVSVAV
jgi:hypothetical protein